MNAIVVTNYFVLLLAGIATSFLLWMKLRRVAEGRDVAIGERNHLRSIIDVEKKKYEDAATRLTKNFNASHAHFISQALVGQSAKELQDAMTNNILTSYKKMGQEFIGGINDLSESAVRDLNFSLTDKIWDSFQQLKESHKDTPQIFPNNTKLAYTKGVRTVVVIEQPPQLRSVSFAKELMNDSVAEQSQARTEDGYRFRLAFPYVYFVVVFDSGVYYYHEVYFRNKPLTSVREHVYLAPLPNIHRDKQAKIMCMGPDFRNEIQNEGTVARQCELVVADFWQKTFNGHLGTGGIETVDPRLGDYATWQKHSELDSLFVLSVKWTNGKTIKGIVESILERRNRETKTDGIDEQVKKILDDGVVSISGQLRNAYQKASVIDLNKEAVAAINRETLEKVVTSHIARVFQHCTKG